MTKKVTKPSEEVTKNSDSDLTPFAHLLRSFEKCPVGCSGWGAGEETRGVQFVQLAQEKDAKRLR